VTFYTDSSLFNGLAGAEVYSESINNGEAYALGTIAIFFQTEVRIKQFENALIAKLCC
jgi:hypothetical protein